MSSLEEIDIMRNETMGGLHAFYRSMEGDHNPIQMVGRIQGKITELIDYIQVLEEYINALPCTPRNRDKPETARACPYLRTSEGRIK